jgi:hypothetical protein
MFENTEGAINRDNPEKLAVASFSGLSFLLPFGIL